MGVHKTNILIVDDDVDVSEPLKRLFVREGYNVFSATTGDSALSYLKHNKIDILITDLRLPDTHGINLMNSAFIHEEDITVIIMTGYSTMDTAISAIKQGAYYYFAKPFDIEEMLLIIKRAINEKRSKLKDVFYYSKEISEASEIIAYSPNMRGVVKMARKIAPTETIVLIEGESGSGKEVLAKEIHKKSGREKELFVPVNCASIPRELIESELFGHVKGAFTGAIKNKKGLVELADKGTLFLDEIGELPLELQAKLLRFLQEFEFKRVGGIKNIKVDTRVIAATNRDLTRMVKEGKFREDLFYRINVFPLKIPPLRERREDIVKLAGYFLKIFSKKAGKSFIDFSSKAINKLLSYSWPGNVRELKNIIERAVLLEDKNIITDGSLVGLSNLERNDSLFYKENILNKPFKQAKEDFEREYLKYQIKKYNGNISRLAKAIGLHRSSVYDLMKRLDIPY